MENDKQKALEILKRNLVGGFIERFSVGSSWTFAVSGENITCKIVTQNIISDDEALFTPWLSSHYSPYRTMVDKYYIAKCAIIAAHMNRLITDVILDDVFNLTIEFEHGGKITLPTTEDIVDWQWAVNETGKDPYHDYMVACFWCGEINVA